MAWCRTGGKPLAEPMLTKSMTLNGVTMLKCDEIDQIYVVRLERDKISYIGYGYTKLLLTP